MAKEKLTYQGTKPTQEDFSDTAHALPTAGNSPGDKADNKTLARLLKKQVEAIIMECAI